MALFVKRDEYRIQKHGLEIDDAVLTITENDADKIEWPLNRFLLSVFWLFIFFVFIGFGGRVFYLNVIKGSEYRGIAQNNSLRKITLPAPRGIIYDRFGKQLVSNIPSIDIVLIPIDMPKEEQEREKIKNMVLDMFSLEQKTLDDIFSKIDLRSLEPLLVKENITQEETILFVSRARELPGVSLYKTTKRQYTEGLIFSHILGYEGKVRREDLIAHPRYSLTDSLGKQGIEKTYESLLRGVSGFQQAEVDSLGHIKKELGIVSPRLGNDLILNIDADLQKKIFDDLQAWLEKKNLKQAVVIAMDPRDGAVRALVSFPSYDNNLFVGGISSKEYKKLIDDTSLPLFNRAVSGEYPPGSTLKPVIASAALKEGVINESRQVESRGGISVGKFFFGDWRVNGFTDVRRAIAVSSDVFFYAVGGGYGGVAGLGMDRMKKYENLFGYGSKTNIDLPGEADGFIPDPQWKKETIGERWYIGDDYHASIGQGFITATPLQILNSICAIANNGILYVPRIASQVRSPEGVITSLDPQIIRKDFMDKNILRIVREGMRKTVTEGTAQPLQSLSVEVAGKTGTAQFGNANKTHGWFVSFAPYTDPTLAMIVLVEGQGEEGYNAVPLTQSIYEWYFSRTDPSEK